MRYTGFFDDIRYDEASDSRRFTAVERTGDPAARWAGIVTALIVAMLILAFALLES